jgi:hypothetical protein
LTATFWAVFFDGAYFPQKLAQKTSIGTRYNLFQVYASFYILKISPGLFVLAAPPLRTGAIIKKNEKDSLKIRGYREKMCKVLAAQRIFSLDS